jgi:spore coat protein A, manganese oxidase
MTTLGRRRLLVLGALSATGAAGWAGVAGNRQPGALVASEMPLPEPYRHPLTVPTELKPVRTTPDEDHYEITHRTAALDLTGHGIATEAWTYNGTFPGPTIRATSRRRTVVRHINKLPVPTVVHLHGGHTPHDSDGYPGDLILPRDTPYQHSVMPGMTPVPGSVTTGERTYVYPGRQRAATLWYHDHRHGFTGPGLWHGLAGFHLIQDDDERSLSLPDGDRDLPLMIVDRAFDRAGRLRYPARDPSALHLPGVTGGYENGALGDVILVNGTPWPVRPVERAKYRLRLLNASNSRRYRLALRASGPRSPAMTQIASDGGLLERPVPRNAIELAPGERAEVVVDFAQCDPGERIEVRNLLGAGSTSQVMRFDVSPSPVAPPDPASVPDRLSDAPVLSEPTVTRDFSFHNGGDSGWVINGRPYDPAHPMAVVRLGRPERWRLVSDLSHPVHLHLQHFRVLGRDLRGPGPYDVGWKDTVDLRPAQGVEILVRFTDYRGRYSFHCHNLEHEDMAMMADFIVE